MQLVLVINSAFFTRDQSGIITFFHGTNAVRSVQTHSSPRVSLAREIATLTCIAKKNSQVGVSRLTRRNLPLSLNFLPAFSGTMNCFSCYLLSLPLAVRSARYAS